MIIAAKYPSTCPKCGSRIAVGSRVEWSKGQKAAHESCPASRGAAPATSAATPRQPSDPTIEAAPYVRGEKWAPCKRASLPDTTGEVRIAGPTRRVWASLRQGASGEPAREGEAFVVVAQRSVYESAEQNEDCGDMTGPGWQVTLYLRRATAEEGAPELALYAAAKAKDEAADLRERHMAELTRLCEAGLRGCDAEAECPEGRAVEISRGTHGSGRQRAVLSPDGGAVALWCGGYYDDYRPTLSVTREPRAVEIMAALLAEVAS